METRDSKQARVGFLALLSKADFDPDQHPRDSTGAFVAAGGGRAPLPPEKPKRVVRPAAVRALAHRAEASEFSGQASALRRAGEGTLAQAAENAAVEARKKADKLDKKPPMVAVPKPLPPASPPAPKPVAPKVQIPQRPGAAFPAHPGGGVVISPSAIIAEAARQAAASAAAKAPAVPLRRDPAFRPPLMVSDSHSKQELVGPKAEIADKHAEEIVRLGEHGFRMDVRRMHPDGGAQEIWVHPDGRRISVIQRGTLAPGQMRLTVQLSRPEAAAPPQAAPLPPGQYGPRTSIIGKPETMQKAALDSSLISGSNRLTEAGGEKGIGETHFVDFKDGSKAVYKPTAGTGLVTRPWLADDFHLDKAISEAKRDRAAFEMSEAMDMAIVPHVEIVDYKNIGSSGGGHAQAFVNGKPVWKLGESVVKKDLSEGHPDLHRLAALDVIMGNTDRHAKNFMKGDDGRYYAIDNGLAGVQDSKTSRFRSALFYGWPIGNRSDGPGMIEGKAIPKEVQDEIKRLTPDKIAKVMTKAGFKPEDIKGAQCRHQAVSGLTSWPVGTHKIRGGGRKAGIESILGAAKACAGGA